MSDIISRADALEQMAQAECGLHYDDCEADNCSCSYIKRILDIPSADAVSREEYEDIIKDYRKQYENMNNEIADLEAKLSADAVEVVRCKDCMHRHEYECPMYHEEWFTIDEGGGYEDDDYNVIDKTCDDGFCQYGEREEK